MKVIFGIFLLLGILFGIAFAADHDYSLRCGAMVGGAIMGGLAGAGVATESLREKK